MRSYGILHLYVVSESDDAARNSRRSRDVTCVAARPRGCRTQPEKSGTLHDQTLGRADRHQIFCRAVPRAASATTQARRRDGRYWVARRRVARAPDG